MTGFKPSKPTFFNRADPSIGIGTNRAEAEFPGAAVFLGQVKPSWRFQDLGVCKEDSRIDAGLKVVTLDRGPSAAMTSGSNGRLGGGRFCGSFAEIEVNPLQIAVKSAELKMCPRRNIVI